MLTVSSRQSTSVNPSTSIEGTFGVVLRILRFGKDMSQEELAHVSGYHRNYIGMLERGEKSPSLRTLFNLAGALSTSPSEILKSVEDSLKRRGRAV
ncbi:MAG: helix-turn-helix transcriptional regulator [Terracidiphilus sp.]|nr:helix-turn-helix transcriptional regulator [Terracidiphilus sp.]